MDAGRYTLADYDYEPNVPPTMSDINALVRSGETGRRDTTIINALDERLTIRHLDADGRTVNASVAETLNYHAARRRIMLALEGVDKARTALFARLATVDTSKADSPATARLRNRYAQAVRFYDSLVATEPNRLDIAEYHSAPDAQPLERTEPIIAEDGAAVDLDDVDLAALDAADAYLAALERDAVERDGNVIPDASDDDDAADAYLAALERKPVRVDALAVNHDGIMTW